MPELKKKRLILDVFEIAWFMRQFHRLCALNACVQPPSQGLVSNPRTLAFFGTVTMFFFFNTGDRKEGVLGRIRSICSSMPYVSDLHKYMDVTRINCEKENLKY